MKESKNKKTFDGKSGGSVGIGLALGLAIGLMMGVDDEASKPIDPDDPDDEDLNEDTDQYN